MWQQQIDQKLNYNKRNYPNSLPILKRKKGPVNLLRNLLILISLINSGCGTLYYDIVPERDPELIPYLEEYKIKYNPSYWLFEGQNGGQYSKSSIQKVFRIALEQSRIFAYGTVHTLRHSYATHCVENGFSIALLQEALGHGSIKTTEKYLHISNKALKQLKSPLDIIKGKHS